MATYPDDATAPVSAFGVVSTVAYTNTGASRTDFNLAATADHRGEVLAIVDGITQKPPHTMFRILGQPYHF